MTGINNIHDVCVAAVAGSRDTGRIRSTEVRRQDDRELESVKSAAGFVSSHLSEDDRLHQLGEVRNI